MAEGRGRVTTALSLGVLCLALVARAGEAPAEAKDGASPTSLPELRGLPPQQAAASCVAALTPGQRARRLEALVTTAQLARWAALADTWRVPEQVTGENRARHEEWMTRERALRRPALAELGQAVPSLRTLLQPGDPELTRQALRAAQALGPAAAELHDDVAAMLRAPAHQPSSVRQAAVLALASLRPEGSLALLQEIAGNSKEDLAVVANAFAALARLGPRAGPALLAALAAERALQRLWAVQALARAVAPGDAPALAALRSLMGSEPDPMVRAAAARALLKLSPDKRGAVRELTAVLQKLDRGTCWQIQAEALREGEKALSQSIDCARAQPAPPRDEGGLQLALLTRAAELAFPGAAVERRTEGAVLRVGGATLTLAVHGVTPEDEREPQPIAWRAGVLSDRAGGGFPGSVELAARQPHAGLVFLFRVAQDGTLLDARLLRLGPQGAFVGVSLLDLKDAGDEPGRWPLVLLRYHTAEKREERLELTAWSAVYDGETASLLLDVPLSRHPMDPEGPVGGWAYSSEAAPSGELKITRIGGRPDAPTVEEKTFQPQPAPPYAAFLPRGPLEVYPGVGAWVRVSAQDLASGWSPSRRSRFLPPPEGPAARVTFYLDLAQDPRQAGAALGEIARMGSYPADSVPVLLDYLESQHLLETTPRRDLAGTFAAIDIVQGMGSGALRLLPRLEALAASEKGYLRSRVLLAIYKVTGDVSKVLPALSQDSLDPVADRGHAIAALGQLPARDATPVLVKVLESGQGAGRRPALDALRSLGAEASAQALPVVRRLLRDADASARQEALSFLVARGSAEHLSDIVPLLRDDDEKVRNAAFTAVRQSGLPALEPLTALARDAASPKRREAIWAIAQLGPPARAALPVLVASLDDPNADVRSSSAAAICSVGKDALPIPELMASMRQVPEPERTLALLEILRDGGTLDARAIPFIKAQLFSPHEKVRLTALRVTPKLGEAGHGLAWTLIEKLDASYEESEAARRALEAWPSVTPILIEGLANTTGRRQLWLVHLVGQRVDAAVAALPWLDVLASSRDEEIREAAALVVETVRGAAPHAPPAKAGSVLPPAPRSDEHLQDFLEDDQAFCREHDAERCLEQGLAHAQGTGLVRDPVRGARLLQCACEKRSRAGCVLLGEALLNGKGVARDSARAVALFREQCAGQLGAGCGFLGNAYSAGDGVPRDDRRAAELYQQACDLGDGGACFNLGLAWYLGENHPASLSRALHYYERGCDGGVETSCQQASALREMRPGEQACEGGEAARCTELGETIFWAVRTARGSPLAVHFHELGCTRGDPHGCLRAGFDYEQGLAAPRDARRAADLYTRACDGGQAWGCASLAKLYERGEGVAADAARARALAAKACRGGVKEACR